MDVRIQADALGRLLHHQIYARMVAFAQEYTPEFPAEPIVTAWLNRVYSGDEKMHVLVTLNEQTVITGHIVVEVQDVYGYRAVWCHQAQGDKGNNSTVDKGVEYVEKLCALTGAVCSLFTVVKNVKMLEKKYGYKTMRTVMVKSALHMTDTAEGEGGNNES